MRIILVPAVYMQFDAESGKFFGFINAEFNQKQCCD